MSKIQHQITEKFLARMAASNNAEIHKIERLRKLLTDGRKIKAEDLLQAFTLPGGAKSR